MDRITSLQNVRIKNVHKLAGKARERKAQNLFMFEGARELSLAIEGSYELDSVFVCPELFEKTDYPDVLKSVRPDIITEVSETVFEKIAYREGSDGLLVLAVQKKLGLQELDLPDNPFIILLEAVEKPGNLGAILRTADAAKADAVIICDPLTDIYNPNAVRSSVGCLFTVPVAVSTNEETFQFLSEKGIYSYATDLNATQWYHETDFRNKSAIIMGTEADGLSPFWLQHAHARIKIPMRGKIDSLNVSVSTAIICFEAMRQRSFL